MPTLGLREITKVYPDQTLAVDNLSLDVDRGEFVVLLGPSGCGKSTVLRMIAGLEEVTTGTLRIGHRLVNDLPPRERNVAMVFQHLALYPYMSVRDNLSFGLRVAKKPSEEIDQKVDAVSHLLGLDEHLQRMPAHLSGGERQRVAMGRAIVRRPEVFLMDEPLSNLDAQLRTYLRAEIVTLIRELGTTTVYVTHDQSEAMSMGDRIAVMRDGRLQQVGGPREIYDLPANVFVATFVGSPRMNLLTAVVGAQRDGSVDLDLGAQRLAFYPEVRDHAWLRTLDGQEVIVGLRPEALRVGPREPVREGDAAVQVDGWVRHVEFLGHETLLHIDTGSRRPNVPHLEALPDHQGAADSDRGRRVDHGERSGLGRRVLRRMLPATLMSDGEPAALGTARREPSEARQPGGLRHMGDLVARLAPGTLPRVDSRVTVRVALHGLYVFNLDGQRVCPLP